MSSKPGNGGQGPADGQTSYEIGNKKPPKEHQFKPGKSGNAKGRPPGSKSFEAKLQKELSKLVVVNKNGKASKMSKLDVGVTRLVDRFMSGDLKSTAIILSLDKKKENLKIGSEVEDDLFIPDQANLEFIFGRLKGLIKGGSGGASDE